MVMRSLLKNRLIWMVALFVPTLFLPWREIYKGTGLFTVLPLWWAYGRPLANYPVILGHVLFSVIGGLLLAALIRRFIKM